MRTSEGVELGYIQLSKCVKLQIFNHLRDEAPWIDKKTKRSLERPVY